VAPAQVSWEANVKDANCDMTAHILGARAISITWDTSAASSVDHLTDAERYRLNYHGAWATRLGLPPPDNPHPRPADLS
jgi:hypothetical protein